MAMLPITYGYARVSKADDARNWLTTECEDLIFSDVASGRTMNRTGLLNTSPYLTEGVRSGCQ